MYISTFFVEPSSAKCFDICSIVFRLSQSYANQTSNPICSVIILFGNRCERYSQCKAIETSRVEDPECCIDVFVHNLEVLLHRIEAMLHRCSASSMRCRISSEQCKNTSDE